MFCYFTQLWVYIQKTILPLDILKFIITTLKNQDKKVALIRVEKYGAMERSSEFVKTRHNINTIIKNTDGDASSLNGKIEIPNKKLANIKISLLLNSSHKK